ncbi:DegT/DnrJ/EryC1/StrS family aminotransferase [Dyella sp. Tek66A03]|uniref:DegT/DnrJ/EryC1/StrS family aminotransferase n=1 Tax=Dyella sp. Tek66A03 TaxID=3458298 RepID=UPI00403EC5C6
MTDLQAAISIHQLARVEMNWEPRPQIWRRCNEALAVLPIDLPAAPEEGAGGRGTPGVM